MIFVLLYMIFHSATEAMVLIFPTFYAMTGGLILQWLLGYNFSVAGGRGMANSSKPSNGWDNITTWLDAKTVVAAFICFAMLFFCSGAIILSLLATMYQLGLSCHTAALGLAMNMDRAVCGWPQAAIVLQQRLPTG